MFETTNQKWSIGRMTGIEIYDEICTKAFGSSTPTNLTVLLCSFICLGVHHLPEWVPLYGLPTGFHFDCLWSPGSISPGAFAAIHLADRLFLESRFVLPGILA